MAHYHRIWKKMNKTHVPHKSSFTQRYHEWIHDIALHFFTPVFLYYVYPKCVQLDKLTYLQISHRLSQAGEQDRKWNSATLEPRVHASELPCREMYSVKLNLFGLSLRILCLYASHVLLTSSNRQTLKNTARSNFNRHESKRATLPRGYRISAVLYTRFNYNNEQIMKTGAANERLFV